MVQRNSEHERVIRSDVQKRLNFYYQLIRKYRRDSEFKLPFFEPPLSLTFLKILEGILCVWSRMWSNPLVDTVYNSPASMRLCDEIRKNVDLAVAPDWKPSNAASQFLQVCKAEDNRLLWETTVRNFSAQGSA